MQELVEETIESKTIFNGKVVKLDVKEVRLPNGKAALREIVNHQGGVAVIPYQNGEITLIKQFRKAAEEVLYELPAGLLEVDENPQECAQRELKEETGYLASSLKKICDFYTSPGFSSELLHIYLATDLVEDQQEMDEDEFIELEKMSLTQAKEKLAAGEFKDAKTIIGLQYLLTYVSD
ncbi:MAG: NUDIX hydrolase [Bacillota bacterium]